MLTADEGLMKHRREFDDRNMGSRLRSGKRHWIESGGGGGDKEEHALRLADGQLVANRFDYDAHELPQVSVSRRSRHQTGIETALSVSLGMVFENGHDFQRFLQVYITSG